MTTSNSALKTVAPGVWLAWTKGGITKAGGSVVERTGESVQLFVFRDYAGLIAIEAFQNTRLRPVTDAHSAEVWRLCSEAATPSLYRHAQRQARAGTTFLTNVFTGRPARILVNRLALEVGPISDALPDFPLPMRELALWRSKRGTALHAVLVWSSRTAGRIDADRFERQVHQSTS